MGLPPCKKQGIASPLLKQQSKFSQPKESILGQPHSTLSFGGCSQIFVQTINFKENRRIDQRVMLYRIWALKNESMWIKHMKLITIINQDNLHSFLLINTKIVWIMTKKTDWL